MIVGKDKKKMGDIVVNVYRAGSKGTEVALNGDRTVRAALRAAGLQKKESEVVNINGVEVEDLDQELEHEDRVVLVKNIQGGLM